MNNLEQQLKFLQTQKLKSEFLKDLKSHIGNFMQDKYSSVEKEIKDMIFKIIDEKVLILEDCDDVQGLDSNLGFSKDDVLVLKAIVSKARAVSSKQIPKTLVNSNDPKSSPANIYNNADEPQDALSFALKYKHLEAKRVKIGSHGDKIGIVTGLLTPNIVIRLETGGYINVSPKDLEIL